MKKKIGIFSVVLFSMIALGTAQSYTLTDADSNLTDTQLTADFSGLPADTQLTLQSLGSDITEQATFTSTSGGSATVSWRHNPFEDGTALVSDGWTYRIRDSSGNFNYEFEILHGNQLSFYDTFYDNQLKNIYVAQYRSDITESNQQINHEITDGDTNSLVRVDKYVNKSEVFIVEINTEDATDFVNMRYDLPNGSTIEYDTQVNNFPSSDFILKAYYEENSGNIIFEADGEVITETSAQSFESFKPLIQANGNIGSQIHYEEISYAPKISKNAWQEPNQFSINQQLGFNDFIANQVSNVGVEFSTDGSTWSTTLPSSGNTLYYRNTGTGTIGNIATDTQKVFEELTFNPIRPDNNTAFVVEENASLNRDFLYEILYERTDCSEFAGLFSAFSLYNQSSGNTITDTVYPNLEMTENQCVFYKEFTEEENLPAGDYRWRVEFQDSNLGISEVWNQYFSIEEAQDVPVSFELRDPAEGETVFLDNGSTEFSYSVDADTEGTLELVIPQYDDSVRYSTTIGSGNQTGSVVLNLDYGANYDWYLTWTNSTTYQSETNSFNTASEGESPDDGTNGGGDDGTQDGNLIVNIWFSILEYFGITGTVADVFTASLLVMAVTIAATLVTDSVLIGVLGFNLGLTVTTIAGLLPGWMLFLQITLAGVAAAYLYQKVSSS